MNERIFDTRVQWLKYKVLKEIAKSTYADTLQQVYHTVPKIIVPDGAKATMRCCIYKERGAALPTDVKRFAPKTPYKSSTNMR